MATEIASAYISLITQFPGVKGQIEKGLGGSAAQAGASKSGKTIGAAMFGAFAGIAQSVTTKAFGAISDSLSGAISRVDIMANYPKIMQNLGYSSQDASASIAKMSDKLTGLPTALDAMAGVVQQLAPLTGGLDQATDLSLALNNALLAGGKGADIQRNALEQYSQMLGNGVPDLQAWRSMVAAMPGQMNQLAQSLLGANAKQMDLYDAMKSGKVSFDDFNGAILKLNDKGLKGYASFSKQARDATQGIATQQANLGTAITRGMANIIQKLKPQITGFLSGLTDAVNAAGPVILGVIDGIGAAFAWIGQNLDWITPTAIALGTVAAGFAVMNAAATVAAAGGLAKWIAATKIGTGIQAAFNVVMNANPIMLVITAIAALVAGLVYFFTQTKTGQAIWVAFTKALGAAWNWFWKSVIQPVAGFISGAIKAVGAVGTWLWKNAMKPAIDGIVAVVKFMWGFIRPIFDLWVVQFKLIGAVAAWLWNNAIVPAAKGIGKIFSWLWTNAVKPIFGWIGDKARLVGLSFKLLYQSYIKPAFDRIGSVFKWIWQSIVKPIFDKIGKAVKLVGDAIGTAFRTAGGIIRDAFNGIVGFVKGVFNGIISAVNGVINGINGVAGAVGKVLGVDLHISTIPMLADGGTLTRGGSVIVGEEGPELLNLPRGAQVVPNYDRSVSRVDGGSSLGGDINIYPTLVPERGIPMSVQLNTMARMVRGGGIRRSVVKAVSA